MVDASLILVLALVSSTVVAQPKINGFTSPFACFKRQTNPEISTESLYEWITPSEGVLKSTSDEDSVDIGLNYILQKLKLQSNEFKLMTSFTDNLGITHLYGVPLHKELPIGNLHAATHVKNGQVFFYSATIIVDDHVLKKRSLPIPKSTVKISSEDAVKAAVDCLKIPFYSDVAPVMESYWTENGNIFVWVVQLRDHPTTQWIEVKVDANTGVIVSKESFKRDFTYTAIELPNKSPHDGFSTIVDPENLKSSPNGWTEGFELKGNNVLVNYKKRKTFGTSIRGMFSGVFDPTLPPQTPKNLVTGAINAFYAANTFHDVLYQYGFNEKAGNFQTDNFKRGGIDGDPIIINVQSRKETDNAYFLTPPDGRSGVLNLHIFTATDPNRDPALDSTVIIHELAHGVSSRLTGGARTKGCMTETASKGLSEGYSDVISLIFTAKPEDTRNTKKVMGEYIEGDTRGSRWYPYTTNMRFNPLTYKDAVREKDRHRLGEIWAVMLFEVYWNLVEEYGFSANLHDATQKQGNIIFLQLFCRNTDDSAMRPNIRFSP
ncbi:hypothetical protein BASA61_004003 [Batrachochytrium salamandrivorans]|nr:hypothetical protein BASA61_004003 [Batrachochytrium salamandrivorans]